MIEKNEIERQRDYYARTASSYDSMHLAASDSNVFKGHPLALEFMFPFVDNMQVSSLLDVGTGTGRTALEVMARRPQIDVVGLEPSPELREVALSKGLRSEQIVLGDAQSMPFDDNSIDFVCAFGVLHHVPKPALAVSEMLRVAKKGIFISDNNNWGQGNSLVRLAKQMLNFLQLWPIATYIQTSGKGYKESKADGIYYSYSIFNNIGQIEQSAESIYLMGTGPHSRNLYRTAGNIALCAVMKSEKP